MDNSEVNTSNVIETKNSLVSRIWRYKFCYLISIPALLFIILMKYVPVIAEVRLPFIDYKPAQGIMNSKWVGMENLKSIISQYYFPRIIQNSIILNVGFITICSAVAFIMIWGLSRISSKKTIAFFTTIFLIPLFIPPVVISRWLIIASSKMYFLSDPVYARLAYICVETLKYSGIPIILGIAAVNSYKSLHINEAGEYEGTSASALVKPVLKVIAAFSLIQLSLFLTDDFELVLTMYNPKVYTTMDVFDTYMYRAGILQFGFSKSAAIWLIKLVVQLVTVTIAYLLVKKLFKNDLFKHVEEKSTANIYKHKGTNWVGLIPVLLYSGAILYILFMILVYPFTLKSPPYGNMKEIMEIMPQNAFYKHFLASIAAVAVNAFITVTLAYPLTARKLPGRSFIKAILIAAMGIGSYTISEYLYYRSLGMANTYLPFVIISSFNIINIFVLKSIFNSKYTVDKDTGALSGKSEGNMFFTLFLPKVWRPLIALSVLQFSSCWGSFYTSMIFTTNRNIFTPILIFRETALSISNDISNETVMFVKGASLQLGAVITVVPIVLFLIFRHFFTSETFVGQIRK